jgi:hypothetical protein
MSTAPTLSGFKPVAWAGESVNITLSGVASNTALSFSLDGSPVTAESQWGANNTVTLIVPAGDAVNATVKRLEVDLGGGNSYTVNVTVLPHVNPPAFPEDPTWIEMFEGGGSGWNIMGWTLDTLAGIIGAHGTLGKQRFTRESGVIAAAVGAGTHTLRSPPVALDGKGDYELRFASHYNNTGRPEGQRATVSVSYGDTEVELMAVNGTQESIMHSAKLSPPSDTATATFTFTLDGGDDVSYWLIDDVEVVHPLSAPSGEPLEVIDIISDIQGIQQNAQMSESLLPGLRKLNKATTLVINGDLVNNDTPESWSNFTAALNSTKPLEYYQDLISVCGNHEMYFNENKQSPYHIDNFLTNTEMTTRYGEVGRGLYGEHVTAAGTPLIWLASEFYDFLPNTGFPPFVELSDAQFLYLAERLAFWRSHNRAVLLFSHYPLPYSVSGTWDSFEYKTFGEDQLRFQYLLAANPHALLITSHTHYDIAANDQNVNYRALVGHNSTVTTFNTGATLNWQGIGPIDYSYHLMGHSSPTGLQAEIYEDRIRVKAYRFWNLTTDGTLMHTRDVGSPLNPLPVNITSSSKNATAAATGSNGSGRLGGVLGLVVLGAIFTLVAI